MRKYKVTVRLRPASGQQYTDPQYVADTQATLESFRKRFDGAATSIETNQSFRPPAGQFWVAEIVATFDDRPDFQEIGAWLLEPPAARIGSRGWNPEASSGPASIAHSRWVRVEPEGAMVKDVSGPALILCSACGWRDYAAVPDPFEVSLPSKRNILVAQRGLLIVDILALSAFRELIPDEFDTGAVAVRGDPSRALHWVRPRQSIGGYPTQQEVGRTCEACGLPDRFNNGHNTPDAPGVGVVRSFGDERWNLVRIGSRPQMANRLNPAETDVGHDLAISGGLFAALFNRGLKGLDWPDWGPLISLDPREDTWDARRRFAPDGLGRNTDKFLKRKEPDWRS